MIEPRMYIKKCFADLVVKYGSIFGKAFTGGRTMRTEEEKAIIQDLFVPLVLLCFALFGFCMFTCIKSEVKKETKYYEKYPECISACNPIKCTHIKRRLEKYND